MKTIVGLYVAMFALGVAVAIGWVLNIIQIIAMIGGEFTAELVVRLVGVPVVPLGAILGYFV
jgi:hypothetical protein